MNKILIVSGHTNLDDSFVNKLILEELKEKLPDAVFTLLDRQYPEFRFDVATEQKKLVEADVIVLQFPFFWYGIPSIMKKWMEDVFVHGFSHGSKGNKLHGKKMICSFTSGAPEEMYQDGGAQNYPIEAFLPPLKQFANLCGIQWTGYVYTGALSYALRNEGSLESLKSRAIGHAGRLISLLENPLG